MFLTALFATSGVMCCVRSETQLFTVIRRLPHFRRLSKSESVALTGMLVRGLEWIY